MNQHDSWIERLAVAPSLLIACDFDGTLSPIVNDPGAAVALPGVAEVLRRLARLPETAVAVISGRALADLEARLGAADNIHLIGSHGAEWRGGETHGLTADALQRRDRIARELRAIADRFPGCTIEQKPSSIALHYRNASEESGLRVVQAVLGGPATLPDVHVKRGKKVIELAVVAADKGSTFERLRHQLGDPPAIFIGDDVTDEDVFRRLREGDVGVKVGEGDTAALRRVSEPVDVLRILEQLTGLRQSRPA